MAFAFEIDTLEGVDDGIKAAYEENEGKYVFNPDKYAELKGAGVKKNAIELKKEKDKLKAELEATRSKFADLDDDALTAFKEWQAQKQQGDHRQQDDEAKGTPEEIRARLKTAHEAELRRVQAETKAALKAAQDAKDKELAAVRADHLQFVKRTKLSELADETGVIPERRKLWLREAESRYGLNADGELAVLDENGDPDDTVKPDAYSRETLKREFDFLYAAQEQGGSGSGGSKSAGTGTGLRRSKMTTDQKGAFIRQHGSAVYDRLPL